MIKQKQSGKLNIVFVTKLHSVACIWNTTHCSNTGRNFERLAFLGGLFLNVACCCFETDGASHHSSLRPNVLKVVWEGWTQSSCAPVDYRLITVQVVAKSEAKWCYNVMLLQIIYCHYRADNNGNGEMFWVELDHPGIIWATKRIKKHFFKIW